MNSKVDMKKKIRLLKEIPFLAKEHILNCKNYNNWSEKMKNSIEKLQIEKVFIASLE